MLSRCNVFGPSFPASLVLDDKLIETGCWNGATNGSAMRFISKSVIVVVFVCASTVSGVVSAAAQEHGKRPVRLLVPSAPGGPSDFAARLIAPKLSEALGQNVVVDNRQSVNGILATEIAAK